jgi:multicomponent Na+:H+ antiporter subunit E
MWQIVLANIDVAKRVWSPVLPIAPRVIRLPHRLKTAFGISTYANSITLTPATVTIEIGTDEFIVHALTKECADDLLQGGMHDRCLALEPTSNRGPT